MLRLAGRSVREVGEVSEWMMMELKERIGMAGERIVPSSRVPGPGDTAVSEPVSNGGKRLVREKERWVSHGGRMWAVDCICCTHHKAVGRHLRVTDQRRPILIQFCNHAVRGVRPDRRARAGEPHGVQE